MRYRVVLFFTLFSFHATLFSQDFQAESRKLIEAREWDEALTLLKQWEKKEPASAEMRIAYFNFYLEQSRNQSLQPGYDGSLFNLALDQLRKGIKHNPERLDMYLGIASALREKGDIDAHVKELTALIDLNKKRKPGWLWTNDEPVEGDPEAFFKGTIQSYNHALFRMRDPEVDAIEAISRKMMQHYPDDVENYSNIGACHMLRGNVEEALTYFHQARDKAPNDMLVVSNIARAYVELGRKDKAIEYYQVMERQGNMQEVDFAKHQIVELKK